MSYDKTLCVQIYYDRCFKTLNTSCLPKWHRQTVQTLITEAVLISVFCSLLQLALCDFQPDYTNILFANRRRKVFEILENLPYNNIHVHEKQIRNMQWI